MRALRFNFHPERVRITAEEILADLRYPAHAPRTEGGPKRLSRRSARGAGRPV
jgi:hypothetical protein